MSQPHGLSVSIVLATYNGEKFLAPQLASFLSQTLVPCELVVADDLSTDGTLGIIEAFAASAPFPVRLIRNPKRLGYGANFIQACAHARGDLIALSDQDDLWRPDKLERAAVPFADPAVLLSVHRLELIDADDLPIGQAGQGICESRTVPSGGLANWAVYRGCTMVFRTAALQPLLDRFPDGAEPMHQGSFAHDRWLCFIADSLGSTALIDCPLAGYRQHGVNLYGHSKKDYRGSLTKPLDDIVRRSLVYEKTARDRVGLLEQLRAGSTDAALVDTLCGSAERWRKVAEALARRTAIYRAPSRLQSARLWLSCLKDRVYESPHGRHYVNRFSIEDGLTLFKRRRGLGSCKARE